MAELFWALKGSEALVSDSAEVSQDGWFSQSRQWISCLG